MWCIDCLILVDIKENIAIVFSYKKSVFYDDKVRFVTGTFRGVTFTAIRDK